MRTLLFAFLSIILVSCATPAEMDSSTDHDMNMHRIRSAGKYGKDVHWYSLAEGKEKAREEKKPAVIDFFYPNGCPRCDRMNEYVYTNKEIINKLNTEFIPILINLGGPLTEEEKAFGELYEYREECLLLFLDRDGNVVKDPAGKRLCIADYVDTEWFLKYLDMAKGQ